MNVANMNPCGISSSFGLRAGVQRKTKVYIEPSNRDCMAPNSAILSSAPTWNVILIELSRKSNNGKKGKREKQGLNESI